MSKAIELLKDIRAYAKEFKYTLKPKQKFEPDMIIEGCNQALAELTETEAENKRLRIRLEVSRKLGKGHKDRELANAKKCNEYYDQIKKLYAALAKGEKE